MAIRIVNRQRQIAIDRRSVQRLAELILADHGERYSDVSIVFARDPLLHDLNASFRDVDRPTDVLAFPMVPERDERSTGAGRRRKEASVQGGRAPVQAGPERVLGDVIISVDRAIAQAGRYGKTPDQELLKLVSHGVLHLLGVDHESAEDRRRMRNLENRYLRRLIREER